MLHGLLILLTLVALACLPCALAMLVTADVAADAVFRAVRRRVRRIRGRWTVRAAGAAGRAARHCRGHPKPTGPPIEQIAADLRRLGRQRIGVATRSPVWFAAVQRAYDDRLSLACLELEIPQHLRELTGVDLEIERVRVEGELEAAGIGLVSGNGLGGDGLVGGDADHWQDQR